MQQILSYASTVSSQVLILYILIFVGFIITKAHILTEIGSKQITDILFYVATPLVIIDSFSKVEFTTDSLTQLGIATLCAILTHLIALGLGFTVFRRSEKKLKNLLICAAMLSNCGYMSLPLTKAILGEKGVFLVSVYVGIFNIFLWTVGLSLSSKEKLSPRRIILNPGVIGVVIGLIIFFFSVPFRGFNIISTPVEQLANLNTPLAMIIIGYNLARSSIKIKKGDSKMFTAIGLRMVVIPLTAFAIFYFVMGITGDTLVACMIPASAPIAAAVMMFATKFDGDTELASRMVSISHLFAIVTIPLILTLCEFFK